MGKTLKDIQKPIAEELIIFEKYFKESMKSSVAFLDKITYYIVQRKGKQVRPMFVFLASKLWGEVNDATYDTAVLIELVHTGTLVHDDVVDDSNERRGFFSVNALWKNKIAVLVGDFLLSRGFILAVENKRFTSLGILANTIKVMSEGELLQMEKARKLDIKEEVYYDIIRQKTASLIASACSSGASTVTDDQEIIDKMMVFGEKIGMAFQIKDDLFDYGDTNIGKPKGIDIKEKKMTLPLIYALSKATKKEKNKYINYIKKDSENPKKIKEIIAFVKSMGGMDYARNKMISYRTEAIEMLQTFPDNASRKALYDLVFYVTERQK